MGWGDELMVTAIARRMQANDPRRIAVMDKREPWRARWHEIWENNPRIAHPVVVRPNDTRFQWLRNFPGERPYIDYRASTDERYAFKPWGVEPGEIYLSLAEKRFGEHAAGRVVIEPNVKGPKQVNKDWGWANWVRLTELLPRIEWVQLGPNGLRMLDRAKHLRTNSPRMAAAALSGALAVVTSEGGMHHAAAALGKKAVVIFGGFISPEITGYESHVNLYAGGTPCGMRIPCQHCKKAMESIAPEQVAEKLQQLLAAS